MGAVASVEIEIQAASDAPGIPDDTAIRRWVRAALDGAGQGGELDVSVRIVDPAEMQALNREFRGDDRPTNVLSFPAGDVPGLPRGERRALGDLVVCAPVLSDEAVAQGKLLAHHWAHILVHGVLHLIGYDHSIPADAQRMEALETRILAAGGVGDPY
jgi:probable rRNA maturation factor